jgi:hypothetical protein
MFDKVYETGLSLRSRRGIVHSVRFLKTVLSRKPVGHRPGASARFPCRTTKRAIRFLDVARGAPPQELSGGTLESRRGL